MIRQKNMLAKINCISAGMHCQQWSRWTVRGESRQTKLITETRISTVREQEGGEEERGERHSEEKRNEWMSENILVILSSAPLPRCEPWPRAASLPCCPGSAGHKSSFLSKLPAPLRRRRPAGWEDLTLHPPLSEPLAGPARSWQSVADGPGLHLHWGLSSSSPLQFTHTYTQPPDHNPFFLFPPFCGFQSGGLQIHQDSRSCNLQQMLGWKETSKYYKEALPGLRNNLRN